MANTDTSGPLINFQPNKFKRPPVNAWAENGSIFVAYNLPAKPTIPPYARIRGPPRNSELHQLGWVRDGYIYFAFLPTSAEYRGPLLGRLKLDASELRFPIVGRQIFQPETTYYRMELKLAESWQRLAQGLVQVVDVLLPHTGLASNIRRPPDLRRLCRKLSEEQDSKEKCVKVIRECSEAFHPWLALVSFCIATQDGSAEFRMKSHVMERRSVWVGRLLCSSIHPGWVGLLVDSALTWFSGVSRMGTIIDFERDFYALTIRMLFEHNVPVVYRLSEWNINGAPTQNRDDFLTWYRNLYNRNASEQDLETYLKTFVPPRHALLSTTTTPIDRSSSGDNDVFPELEKGSAQKKLESREQFFARREEENKVLIARETPEETQRRLNRDRQCSSSIPGKSTSAGVFVWEKHSRWEIRVKLSSSKIDSVFNSEIYSAEEMSYDPVRHEWDLWSNESDVIRPPLDDNDDSDWGGDFGVPDSPRPVSEMENGGRRPMELIRDEDGHVSQPGAGECVRFEPGDEEGEIVEVRMEGCAPVSLPQAGECGPEDPRLGEGTIVASEVPGTSSEKEIESGVSGSPRPSTQMEVDSGAPGSPKPTGEKQDEECRRMELIAEEREPVNQLGAGERGPPDLIHEEGTEPRDEERRPLDSRQEEADEVLAGPRPEDEDVFTRDLCEEFGDLGLTEVQTPQYSMRTEEAIAVAKVSPLYEMLRNWYGFIVEPDPSAVASNPIPSKHPGMQKAFDNLGKDNRMNAILVDSVSGELEPALSLRLRYFLAYSIAGNSSPLKGFSDLFGRSVKDFHDPRIVVLPTEYFAKAIDHPTSPKIPLYSVEILDKGVRVEDRDYRRLFFWDARTLLAVIRLPKSRTRTISHVAEFLVDIGARFLMAIPRSRMQTPLEDTRVAPLGRRWRNYKPDKGDFAIYHRKCVEAFSIKRFRGALRAGGILWRIASEFIEKDEGLDGPVYEAGNEPLWICDSKTRRSEYVEDGLSMDEVHLLIGAFELCDKESNDKPVICSYWPPPWIWETSGYNVGYWTPDCEDWFVNRLRRMKNGSNTDPLLSVEEWRNLLKRFRDTKRMVDTLEKQCRGFIKTAW